MVEQFFPSPFLEKERMTDWSDYVQIIFNERRLILLVTALFFCGSVAFYSLIPNTYETEVQILVEQLGNLDNMSPADVTQNFRGEDEYYGTQVAVIMGRKVGERLRAELKTNAPFRLSARRVRGTKIISVTVQSQNRKLAAEAANKAVDIYIQEKAQDDLFVARQMLKWLPSKVESGSAASETASEAVASATAGEPAASAASPRQEASADGKTAEFALPNESADPAYQQLKRDKLDTETRISEMSIRYKRDHPALKEQFERLAYVNQQIKEYKDQMMQSFKAGIMGEFHLTNIKVLSPAPVPTNPSKPRRLRGVLTATVMGFAFAVFLILYIEKVNPRIWHEEEIRDAINVPFMGYIPVISGLVSTTEKKSRTVVRDANKPSLQTLLRNNRENPLLADSVAFMRTHLFFSVPYQKSKLLMMTSTTPNEGKSTVIALFALSLASMGKKIVVIDADMRRPFLNIHLGLPNTLGLADYLAGEATLKEIVQPVPDSSLRIITGGVFKSNPAQLLSSTTRFKELLDTLIAENDYVLVDAPPVLYIPDGLIIAKHIQGVVLITSAGMIRRQVLQAVKTKFDQMDRPIIGAVINRADHSLDMKYRRYFRQYKNYYYAAPDSKSGEPGKTAQEKEKGPNS